MYKYYALNKDLVIYYNLFLIIYVLRISVFKFKEISGYCFLDK